MVFSLDAYEVSCRAQAKEITCCACAQFAPKIGSPVSFWNSAIRPFYSRLFWRSRGATSKGSFSEVSLACLLDHERRD